MRPLQRPCIHKSKLLDTYEECANAYSSAVTGLRQKMGVLSKAEYEGVYNHTEELRLKAQDAQEVLLEHITQHGC